MTLKGNISIARDSGGTIRICLQDEGSRVRFVEVAMTPHDFGIAVTGMGNVDCTLDVRGLELVGKIREHKTEIVPYKRSYDLDEPTGAACRAAAPFEVDGWKAKLSDLQNAHNRTGSYEEPAYRVTFERYVDAPEKEAECPTRWIDREEWLAMLSHRGPRGKGRRS